MAVNGRLDPASLAVIPGGTRLGGDALIRADLLPGCVGLQAAWLHRFKVSLRPTSAGDGYRSYQRQVNAFLERYTPATTGYGPFSDVRWWNGVRYIRISGASAAVPGTSNHGWAIAVDWADVGPRYGERWSWLMENAPRFGFTNPWWARDDSPSNGSIEPWHWEGIAVPVSNYLPYLTGLGVTIPDLTLPDALEDDMPLNDADKAWILDAIQTRAHTAVLNILRAPEFELQLARRNEQVANVVALQVLKVLRAPEFDLQLYRRTAHLSTVLAASLPGAPPVDVAGLAAELAASLVPAVTDAVAAESDLTFEQAQAAAEAAVRNVLGSLKP